ncbi:MAG: histidinol-phosphate transaminase [Candidatus Thorarchaeota archaeon]
MRSYGSLFMSRKVAWMQTLRPYSQETTTPQDNLLRLDSNENLLLPVSYLQDILRDAVARTDPRVYSDGSIRQLTDAISEYVEMGSNEIVISAGGDALIELVAGPIMAPWDTALLIEPTFSMYRKCLTVHDRKIRTVSLGEDFSLDVEQVRENLRGTDEVIFLCSPNNPTGIQFDREDVQAIVESTDGLVVLDEAYVEYAPESLVRLVREYDNLFVMRTFSKAFGLAGMRIGYAVTNSRLANTLRKHVVLPYSVSTISLTVARLLLEDTVEISQAVSMVKTVRERLSMELGKIPGVRVFPSVCNFLLLEVQQSAEKLAQRLLDLGIKVRNVDWIHMDGDYLRVTVPPEQELERVVRCFNGVLE